MEKATGNHYKSQAIHGDTWQERHLKMVSSLPDEIVKMDDRTGNGKNNKKTKISQSNKRIGNCGES